MESSILTVLPNLSIGVVCIGALVYVCNQFLKHLDERARQHEASMQEREVALREVEKEVRNTVMGQLSRNTEIMNTTSKVLERAINIMDKKSV